MRKPVFAAMAVFAAMTVVVVVTVGAGGLAVPAAMASAAGGRPVITSVTPPAGPAGGGTTVTIRGTGFANISRVTIGGMAARAVRVHSSQLLTAVTPAHAAGSAAITIEEKAGPSTPSGVRFHYLNRPRITAMSAHGGPVTGGQVVVIDGSNLSYVRTVSFGALRAAVLAGSTSTRLRVRTPASWAGMVRVVVDTWGGATVRSAADLFTFRNPPPRLSGQLTPASGDMVATGTDVTAVTGGQAVTSGTGVSQAPWVVTLAPAAAVPAVGQRFLLKPGGPVFPSGLAGTVTAVDTSASPATITVSAPGSLDSVVQKVHAVFSGPLSDAPSAGGLVRRHIAIGQAAGSINFGSIAASALHCQNAKQEVRTVGGISLMLDHVQGYAEVDAGSLLSKPFVDVWISYQTTLSIDLGATVSATCSLFPASQKLFTKTIPLGATGLLLTVAPDVSFAISAGGTISFQQHSYRLMGLVSYPDGSTKHLDSEASDPARTTVAPGRAAPCSATNPTRWTASAPRRA